jgi:4-hydroxybenzoate polyprenyltransferase
MNTFVIFLLRLILASAFAVVLTRLFHPENGLFFIIGIAVFLLLLAYISEYFRDRKTRTQGEPNS